MRCGADDAGQSPRSMAGDSLSSARPHAVRYRPKFVASDAQSTRTKPGRAAALNRAIASAVGGSRAPGTVGRSGWSDRLRRPLRQYRDRHGVQCGAAAIGKGWPELPRARQRTLLTRLIERIDVAADQIDIHVRPTRLGPLLDVATPLPSATDDEIQILSVPIRLRRAGRDRRRLSRRAGYD
jgi:hypothetical protein